MAPSPSPIPSRLTISGSLAYQRCCIGEYSLVQGRKVHGCPVWKHATKRRWIATTANSNWAVQSGENVDTLGEVLVLLVTTAPLPHESSVVWQEAVPEGCTDGPSEGWADAPSLKCAPLPPPSRLMLSGSMVKQGDSVGVYSLVQGREVHGCPVWKHATKDRWIVKHLGGNWVVQPSENVGKDSCHLVLRDNAAALPHESSVVWQETDGPNSWVDAPSLKCAPPPPPPSRLMLSGSVVKQGDSVGVYSLVQGREVHGCPVWKHTTKDRWIAKASDGNWVVQPGADLGEARSYLCLRDKAAALPHESSVVWQETDGPNSWVDAPSLKCAPPPPPSSRLMLSGSMVKQGDSVGVYSLVQGREVHACPIWKHATKDRWIVKHLGGNWAVQSGENVGKDSCHLVLRDNAAALPHESSVVWQETDGPNSWVDAPSLKCAVLPPVTPPRQPVHQSPPQPPPAPTRVKYGAVVGGSAEASLAVSDLALGTLIIGDPGSGKTWLLKQVIASCAEQLTSIKQIIVLDLKGDLTQMIRGAPETNTALFDQHVDVCVYTVGSDMGLPGTLSPFNRTRELNSFDLTTREGKLGFFNLATDVAADVLSGTVCLDKTGNARLEGGFDMPTRRDVTGANGVRAADDKKIAMALIDSVRKVFFKCKEAGESVPTTYEELLRELKQADKPHVGPANDQKPAREVVMGPVNQDDLDAVKREIEVRMDPSGGLELLYQPIKGDEASPRDDDMYPLDPSTFLGTREAGKRVKLSIVNLALLGNGYGADTMRKLSASTVLRRIEAHAREGTGTQEAPETMVVVDEAHMVMPAVGQTQSGDAVTATAMAKKLLQVHRDKGIPLVLATQRPADLDKNLRGMVTGTRLIGKLAGTDKDITDLLQTVVKNTDLNKSVRDKLKTLEPRQFIHLAAANSVQVVKSSQLKRLHESSAAWVKGFSPQHPLAVHDDERRAKSARRSAAGPSA